MRYRNAILLLVLLAGGTWLWLKMPLKSRPEPHSAVETVSKMDESVQVPEYSRDSENQVTTNVAAVDSTSAQSPGAVAFKAKPIALAAAAEPLQGPEVGLGLKPLTAMENLRSEFRQYCARFGGNPVGTNPEITAALNGANPRQVVFLQSADGMHVNDQGELVDNWGTPFFFHQLSGIEMEIHSAGPDRKMWTRDDLVIQ